MSLHVLASVLLVSLCSLTFDLYFISCYHHSFCFATSTFPVYSNPPRSLSSQGLPGRRTLRVPSRRGGERERDHLQCEGRDARPGAAVGEGADGGPQPRLSAR